MRALRVQECLHFLQRKLVNKVPLSREWRGALEMLAEAGENGIAEAVLIARGFSAEMLKSLVRVGLATPTMDAVRAGGQPAAWTRITDAGRRMLDLPANSSVSRPRLG
jgi:hypothetical protein